MATVLEKVMARKRTLERQHPGWGKSRLLKEAWKPYKGKGKVSGTKKKAAKKRKIGSVRKKAAPKRRTIGTVRKKSVGSPRKSAKKVGTIGAIKTQARAAKSELDNALAKEYVKQYNATTKSAKKKIGKKMTEIKKSITSVKRIINKK